MSQETSLFKEHLDSIINRCWNYAKRCNTHKDELMNAVLGLAGEAGEVADQVKKWQFHTEKPFAFHREKLVSEMGDVYFYLLKLQDLTGITTEECIQGNKEKLQSRHPELDMVAERFADGYKK